MNKTPRRIRVEEIEPRIVPTRTMIDMVVAFRFQGWQNYLYLINYKLPVTTLTSNKLQIEITPRKTTNNKLQITLGIT